MARPLKTLYIILSIVLANHHMCIADCLIHLGTLKIILIECYVLSDLITNIKLYVLDPFHLQAVNNLSKLNQSIYSQDHPKRTSADMELRNLPKP